MNMKTLLSTLALSAALLSGCAQSHLQTKQSTTQQGYTVKLNSLKQSQVCAAGVHPDMVKHYFGYDEIRFNAYNTETGSLHVVINRHSIDSANLEYFSYVLKKDGKTISRWSGDWNQAELPLSNKLWWNIVIVNTNGILTPGVYTLYLKDHLKATDVRCDGLSIFKITVTK